ncbi:MAG: hypothetical protein IT444_05420 [Phycisphaeraceae bacterium]|nr:hypothetical protein [Phycisphaeraceae bacterium]
MRRKPIKDDLTDAAIQTSASRVLRLQGARSTQTIRGAFESVPGGAGGVSAGHVEGLDSHDKRIDKRVLRPRH